MPVPLLGSFGLYCVETVYPKEVMVPADIIKVAFLS